MRLTRRQLLRALGLTAGALHLPSLARAQVDVPRRIVFLFTQHGTVYPNWRMRSPGLPEDRDWQFRFDDPDPASFSPILAPLSAHRRELLVIDGLSMVSAIADVPFNGHDKGTLHALTGANMLRLAADRAAAGGPSVDQIIARGVRRPDRLASLTLAVLNASNGGAVHQAAGVPLEPEADPRAAFDRLFPAAVSPMPGDADRVRAAQGSVLDLVAGEYDRLLPRLDAADRVKVALHRDLVRDLETRLAALGDVQCEAPATPGDVRFDYQASFDAFRGLIAAAFACDLTRVVTVQMAQMPTEVFGAPPGDVHAE